MLSDYCLVYHLYKTAPNKTYAEPHKPISQLKHHPNSAPRQKKKKKRSLSPGNIDAWAPGKYEGGSTGYDDGKWSSEKYDKREDGACVPGTGFQVCSNGFRGCCKAAACTGSSSVCLGFAAAEKTETSTRLTGVPAPTGTPA